MLRCAGALRADGEEAMSGAHALHLLPFISRFRIRRLDRGELLYGRVPALAPETEVLPRLPGKYPAETLVKKVFRPFERRWVNLTVRHTSWDARDTKPHRRTIDAQFKVAPSVCNEVICLAHCSAHPLRRSLDGVLTGSSPPQVEVRLATLPSSSMPGDGRDADRKSPHSYLSGQSRANQRRAPRRISKSGPALLDIGRRKCPI